jgi:serine/threonine-protein kinase
MSEYECIGRARFRPDLPAPFDTRRLAGTRELAKIRRVSEAPQLAVEPGTVIDGRYRIVSFIGGGGMGAVYRARHERIGKDFALKLLRPELAAVPSLEERFNREAVSTALLDDPRIVRVTDFGRTENGLLYMVQELVEGRSLGVRLRAGRLDTEEALSIADQILAALAHAHERGVLHRDLKPDNVMLIERKTGCEVKVLDFGLAKLLSGPDTLTQAGTVLGTPRYMSPEQASAEPLDARSDLYSAGVIVYEMLAGAPPFTGEAAGEVLIKHVMHTPPPVEMQAAAGVDVERVKRAVMRALEKSAEARFANAEEFRQALLQAQPAALATPPSTPPAAPVSTPPAGKDAAPSPTSTPTAEASMVRRKRSALGIGVAVAGCVAAAAAIATWRGDPVTPAEAALAAGDVDRAVAVATAAIEADPRDPRAHLVLGHAAVVRGRSADALAAYKRALELSPDAAADPRLAENTRAWIAKKDPAGEEAGTAIAQHARAASGAFVGELAQTLLKPASRRTAYEALERLGASPPFDRLEYLSAELARNPTDSCAVRRWYVERLAALEDRRTLPTLEKELERRTGPLGLPIHSTAGCMEDLIRATIKKLEPSESR